MRFSIVFLVVFSFVFTSDAFGDVNKEKSYRVVRIVGSSTVYPFSSAVAEQLGATTNYSTPVVEATGSGAGLKLFCQKDSRNSPDITNASRRIKKIEFKLCESNGIKNIIEAQFGYDGIILAQSKSNKVVDFTIKDIFLALSNMVPDKNNTKLIKNPYKNWKDIDSSLPDREIVIYGPPSFSGTRDAIDELVLEKIAKTIPLYKDKNIGMRIDGVYIDAGGDNYNLTVQKLIKNRVAFGILGYGYLEENSDRIQPSLINGVNPTNDNISTAKYPLSRSLYFYTKKSHENQNPAVRAYVNLFMSEGMIGEDGFLATLGLVPLTKSIREENAKAVFDEKILTMGDLVKDDS